jgi:hypothetical protein
VGLTLRHNPNDVFKNMELVGKIFFANTKANQELRSRYNQLKIKELIFTWKKTKASQARFFL